MIYMSIVFQKYESCYPNPLILKVGDKVKILKKETNPEWPDWFFCKTIDNNEGWISIKYISGTVGEVEITKPYNATELTVEPGEDLIQLKEEGGWVWCRNSLGHEGWVPKNIFQK